jgi:hypothetical protein
MAASALKYPRSWNEPHTHIWIDPDAPLLKRVSVMPIIGDGPREMKPGHVYRCRECGLEIEIPERFRYRDS